LRVAGRLAAFEFGVVTGRRYWALKGSIDEHFGRYSPGMVLQLAVVRAAFERGLGAIELLGDNSGWKRRFANATWNSVRIYTWPRTPSGRAEFLWRARVRPGLRAAYLKIGGLQLRVSAQRILARMFRA
jgi:CelD/BcsL family acetyltransferase involved in cellulose biosynthesis